MQLCELYAGKQACRTVENPTFDKAFDVIVCGLGTAGSLAALYAAENGLSVLGVESFTCVGGTHTASGVIHHYFGCPGGKYEALDQEVAAFTNRYTHTPAESRKLLGEAALVNRGVEILYESTVCGVYVESKTVVGLRVLTPNGIADYKAKIVMDCTADAFVAAIAGCETEQGRVADGQMQPYSLVSLMYNGKMYHYNNIDFGRVNQLDPADLSRAVLFSRSYKMAEAHGDREQIAQMPILGIREGRRIIAEEVVTLEDLFAEKQTQTPAFYSYADLDKHGWDIAFDSDLLSDWATGANLGAYNVTVAVSYKALLPKDYEGILVPCRALGVDRDISSCVRMNPDMKKAAETAAQWATLAIRQNQTLRQVPYAQLKILLEESGCLKQQDNRGVRIDGQRNWDGTPLVAENVRWITEPADLPAPLQTAKPGQAIWSARQMGQKAIPVLRSLLTNPNAQKHAAFALAMLGNTEGSGLLREMVTERDAFVLQDCRKNNNLRGVMAVYWLGRLADRQIVKELIGIICDPKELDKPVYHPADDRTIRYKVSEFENVYFQFVSQAVMALVRIGDKHPDLRDQIAKAFAAAFTTDDYYGRITKRPTQSSEGNMTLAIRTVAFSAIAKWNNQ